MLDLVPTVPEIRRLLGRLLLPPPSDVIFVFAWSIWRRMHQAGAALAHYKDQRAIEPQL
jgi:hypothetical protein